MASEPRIPKLPPEERTEAVEALLAPMIESGRDFNIFHVLANHPDLMRRWLVFGNHILGKSTLPERERELAILRVGWLCQAPYEWGQHVLMGREAGLTDDEIRSIRDGADAEGWNDLDRAILCAADELHKDSRIGDQTWSDLSEHLGTQQLMDLVFTIGQYHLVSMALNSFEVPMDDFLPGWDGLG